MRLRVMARARRRSATAFALGAAATLASTTLAGCLTFGTDAGPAQEWGCPVVIIDWVSGSNWGAIHGAVVDADGDRVPRAGLTAASTNRSHGPEHIFSDADGCFTLVLRSGVWRVDAISDAHGSATRSVTIAAYENINAFDFTLTAR